jgi:hypothetical protein
MRSLSLSMLIVVLFVVLTAFVMEAEAQQSGAGGVTSQLQVTVRYIQLIIDNRHMHI